MMHTNQDAQSMEGVSNKASQNVTSLNTTEIFRYETVKSGAFETWHVGKNKSGGYTSAYAQQTYFKKIRNIREKCPKGQCMQDI